MSIFISIYSPLVLMVWLAIWGGLKFFTLPKFWKKHAKSHVSKFFIFFIFVIAFLWIQLEDAMSIETLQILWGIHCILFFSYSMYSGRKILYDYRRIQNIESRRRKK